MKLEEIYRPIEAALEQVHQFLGFEMEQVVAGGRNGESTPFPKYSLEEGESRERVGKLIATGNKYDLFAAKAINYLLTKPGKNLRPALVLFSAGSVGADISETLIQMAAVVELIHSASLVHDDIIDEAERRRNLLSVHKKYGVKIAILIGDVLFSHSFALVSRFPSADNDTKARVYDILTDLTRRMCYGEILEQQILDSGDLLDRDGYLRVLEFKTALLMSAACRCSAILAGADAEEEKALASFGLNFGYAYQLVDDFRDGDSIFRGKLDLMSLASDYVRAAQANLEKLPESQFVTAMSKFAEFVLSAG